MEVFSRESPTVPRHISVGALFNRFKPLKWQILADPSPMVRAVILDSQVRKFIDLDDPDLAHGIEIIKEAGYPIDSVSIIHNPIEYMELP